jgi:hypothetical protein
VVGAPDDDGSSGTSAGAAYVFRWNGSSWAQEQKLTPPETDDSLFGSAVAATSGRVVVAAKDDAALSLGAVYVYAWNGSSWALAQRLPDVAGAYDDFGRAIAAAGDTLAVTARGFAVVSPGANDGAVFVYRWNGAAFAAEQTLLAPDPNGQDLFGEDVAVAGDRILAVALADGEAGAFAGAGYAFRWNGVAWVFEQKLLPPNDGHVYSSTAALGADFAAIGTTTTPGGVGTGRAYLYRRAGSTWSYERTLGRPHPTMRSLRISPPRARCSSPARPRRRRTRTTSGRAAMAGSAKARRATMGTPPRATAAARPA